MMKKQKKRQVKDEESANQKKIESQLDTNQSSLDNEVSEELVVVGIGASAGGLEALQLMLPNLQPDANLAYVIAQHLDPKHRSMLVSLLARHTSMEVLEIKNGQQVKANKIYITPPDRDVTLSGGILHLSKPSAAIGPKPSVDIFFTSLAEDKGENAVGIILSGTGSDGALGVRAVKAGGGITIVQDEATAKYSNMPHAAIELGYVDLILPPKRIGKELQSIVKYPHVVPIITKDEKVLDDYQKILHLLLDRTGCNFSEYKPNTINRRIERRMAVQKLDTLKDYVHYLEHSSTEIDLLYKDILISVTSFFRDREAFKALEEVLPKIIENKKDGKNIRIWVPGCANGEEAYSIAILLANILGNRLNNFNIQIFGTDIDDDAILRARKGIYSEATVVDVDKAIIDRYFIKTDNTFQVIKSIREMVVFARQNVTKDPPFSRLDLISCRNVLIYFNVELQKRVLSIFHYVLNQNGYMFLGTSESVCQLEDLFTPINKRWKIFERRGKLRIPPIEFGERRPPRYQIDYHKPKPVEKEVSIIDAVDQTIADAYGHDCLVVNDKLEVIYVRGNITPYLSITTGEMDLNINNMLRDELRHDLRACINKSIRENTPVRDKKIKLTVNGESKWVTLDIRSIQANVGAGRLILVSFEEEIPDKSTVQQLTEVKGIDPLISELEQELTATKERLQTTVEELETANEELQSMNEELQSTNEELQSSNEELETTNEELQSTNEELMTINEEYQVKSAELASTNSDLENILKRIGFAMVIVDKGLKVTRFTPPASKIFTLRDGDIGQVLTTIPCQVSLPNLRDNLVDVINHEKTIELGIDSGDMSYWMRIFPYYSDLNKPAGAILTFLDKTDIKNVELALCEKEKEKMSEERVLINTIEGEVAIIDKEYKIINANKTFFQIYGLETEVIGRYCYEIIYNTSTPCEGPEHPCPFNSAKETGKPFSTVHTHTSKEGGKKQVEISISPIMDIKGNIDRFLHISRDTNKERKLAK